MGDVTVRDVLAAMQDLCDCLRPALEEQDRKPEVDLVSLAVAVLGRKLTDDQKAQTIRLRRGGAIGITLGCSPGA